MPGIHLLSGSSRMLEITSSHLSNTKVTAQSGKSDLLTNRLHFLFQFSGQFITHRCFVLREQIVVLHREIKKIPHTIRYGGLIGMGD